MGQVKWIQQDNCKVHIKADDPEWLAAVAANEVPVQIYNQPPNSPDTNINDLAFFVSIQSLQHKLGSGTSLETSSPLFWRPTISTPGTNFGMLF